MRRSATLTTRELMATRILLALIVGLLALPLAPALAGCPPDERPCGGTTTTAPSAPTVVPQPEPTPDNVMINVPAPTSPASTQPTGCADYPAPSFSLPHDSTGRLITTGMLWETVRDTLPGQTDWVFYHSDWETFGDPCPTLYTRGVQDKTDLENFLAYLNSLANQSQANNQPTAQPTTAPAPTAAPPANQGQKSPSAQQCAEWRNKLAEARTELAAANAAVDQAQAAVDQNDAAYSAATNARANARIELTKAEAALQAAQTKLQQAKAKQGRATDDKSERAAAAEVEAAEAEVQEARNDVAYWQTKYDDAVAAMRVAQNQWDTLHPALDAAKQRKSNAERAVNLLEANLKSCPDNPDASAA